ncbi:MAG: hypothetical protein V4590_04675 [Bacteroidota bacterium]
MDFYIDENLPNKVAHALHALEGPDGHNVYSTVDEIGAGVLDPDLIVELTKRKGIFLTHDFRMITRKNEFQLLKEQGLTVFFISLPSGCNYSIIYQTIIGSWEDIKKICRKEKHPFLCKMKMRGKPEFL